MDSFLLSLAVAIATGVATVSNELIKEGVVKPALQPAIALIKQCVQAGSKAREKQEALARAVLAAIEDTSQQKGESLAVQSVSPAPPFARPGGFSSAAARRARANCCAYRASPIAISIRDRLSAISDKR